MLNLLIAIIGDTFGRVQEKSENNMYQEMAGIISENSYLIPQSRKEKHCPKKKYLVVVEEVVKETSSMTDFEKDVLEKFKVFLNSYLIGNCLFLRKPTEFRSRKRGG